jgi:hypothetical protein
VEVYLTPTGLMILDIAWGERASLLVCLVLTHYKENCARNNYDYPNGCLGAPSATMYATELKALDLNVVRMSIGEGRPPTARSVRS